MMEEVGTAPLQKKASILPSFSAATDSEAPSFSRLKSLFQSYAQRLEHVVRLLLGAAVGRADRDPLALEVHDGLDARAVLGHDVQRLLVEAHDDAHGLLLRELRDLALVRPDRVIVVGEGHPRLARGEQLQVVDGGGGDLGGRVGVRDVLADHAADRAAQRVPDAPGAAGDDAERELLLGRCRRHGDRQAEQAEDCNQCQAFLHVDLLVDGVRGCRVLAGARRRPGAAGSGGRARPPAARPPAWAPLPKGRNRWGRRS